MASWQPGTDVERCRLILLRHGQTPFSVEGRYAGRADIPLTDQGQEQAVKAGQWLGKQFDIDAAVTSPALRCHQTLAGVEEGAGYSLASTDDTGIWELDFGKWDGETFGDVRKNWPELQSQWFADWTTPAPGGESVQAVDSRVQEARERFVDANWGKTLLVVSHVTPIKALLRWALASGPEIYLNLHLDTSSVSVVDVYNDGPRSVSLVNSTAHLL